MTDDHAQRLAEADRAFLTAPAGCGKTHTIATAVALGPGCQLVLTHTHAGVHALEAKLQQVGARRDSYRVQTIATWALRYVTAYPALSGFRASSGDPCDWSLLSEDDYTKAYEAAAYLLRKRAIAGVVGATYAGVYVDEYQDCTLPQEQLVLALAEVIPCRVLGDPLQGVLYFAGPLAKITALENHGFACLPPLETPMRWAKPGSNAHLGKWLTTARGQLEADAGLDVASWWGKGDYQARIQACRKLVDRTGTVVIILDQPNMCHEIARHLGGCAQSIEEIHSKQLMSFCSEIDRATASHLAPQLVKFAGSCLTGLGKPFEDSAERYFAEGKTLVPLSKHPHLIDALEQVAADGNVHAVLGALEALYDAARKESGRLFRSDLWSGAKRALRVRESRGLPTLEAAARHTRRELAQVGRRLPRVVVARTPLVKGLEFDHAIVFAEGLKKPDLYVAITRGSKSLTVFSDSQVILPDEASPGPVTKSRGRGSSHPAGQTSLPL